MHLLRCDSAAMDPVMIAVLSIVGLILILLIGGLGYLYWDLTQTQASAAADKANAAAAEAARKQARLQKELAHDKEVLSGNDDVKQETSNYFLEQSGLSTAGQNPNAASSAAANTTTPSSLTQFLARPFAAVAGAMRGMLGGQPSNGGVFDVPLSAALIGNAGAPGRADWPLLRLDGFLPSDQLTKVLYVIQGAQVGDVIDLYGLTQISELAYQLPKRPTELTSTALRRTGGFVETLGTPRVRNGVSGVSIGGWVLSRADDATPPGWRLRGRFEPGSCNSRVDAGAGTAGYNANGDQFLWDLFMLNNDGNLLKTPITTCPFDSAVCGAIWAWAVDGRTGILTFADGSRYSFDGRFVRGPL